MARCHVVHERSIQAVYNVFPMENTANSSEDAIEGKEKPLDQNQLITNDNHRKERRYDVKPTDDNNNKHSSLQEPLRSKIGKLRDERNIEAGKRTSYTCSVCFINYKNQHALALHTSKNRRQYKCNECNAVFAGSSMTKHKKSHSYGNTPSIHNFLSCNFCQRVYKEKKDLQSHIFHSHADLIYSGKAKAKDIGSKTSTNVNNSSDTVMKTEEELNNTKDSTLILSSTNNGISKKPSNVKDTRLKELNSKDTALSGELDSSSDSCSIKRGDSIGFRKNNEIDIENTVLPSTSSNKVSHSARIPNVSNSFCTERPFVQIHVDSETMISLLNKEIKTEVVYDKAAAGSVGINSNSVHGSTNAELSKISQELRNSPRRNELNDILNRDDKRIQDKEWKVKFKCKECVVQLERCDLEYEKGTFHQVDSKRMIELAESTTSPRSKIAVKIQPEEYLEFEKPYHPPQIMEFEKCRNVEKKEYQCHFCKTIFSTKQNRSKHIEQFHTVYASNICSARYKTMKDLLNHYLHQHKALKRKTCCVCDEKFYIRGLLKRHMVLHCVKTVQPAENTSSAKPTSEDCLKLKKRNTCKGCKKRFLLNSCLKEHEKVCLQISEMLNKQNIVETENSTPSIADLPKNLESVHGSTLPIEQSINNVCKEVSDSEEKSIEQVKSTENLPLSIENMYRTFKDRLINDVVRVVGYQADVTDRKNFPCSVCKTQFRTFKNLYLHDRKFNKPTNNRCTVCGTAFSTKSLLQAHIVATHIPGCAAKYKLFCRWCKQGFNKGTNLRIHERHSHNNDLQQHLELDSVQDPNPVCKTCNLIFKSYRHFVEHNTYYFKNHVFVCNICDKSFQGMYQLYRHNKFEHCQDEVRKSYAYKCNACMEGFNNEVQLHAHKLHVHSDLMTASSIDSNTDHNYALMHNVSTAAETVQTSFKVYKCDVCYLKFSTTKDLAMHGIEYSNDGNYLCDKCDRRFRTNFVLAKHYCLNHTGDVKNSLKCAFCGEVFVTSESVQSHAQHFHNSQKKIVDSPDTTDLNKEVAYILDEFKNDNYVCLTCNTKFDSNVDLKDHLVNYSDIGVYACNICQRKFTNKNLVENHKMKHLESNVNMFSHCCPICNEGFTSSEDIHMHVLHIHRYAKFDIRIQQDMSSYMNYTFNVPGITRNNSEWVQKPVNKKYPEHNVSRNSNENLLRYSSQLADYKNPFLNYKCTHCMVLFRNCLDIYSHIIQNHNTELFLMIPCRTLSLSGSSNIVTFNVIPNVENTNGHHNNNNLDGTRSESSFYYICIICKWQYSTLRKCQIHFNEEHANDNNLSRVTAFLRRSNSVKMCCALCKITIADEKCFDDHLKIHGLDGDVPSNRAESNGGSETEAMQKKEEGIANSLIHVIQSKRSTLTEQNSVLMPESIDFDNGNVGKLKVKAFAKMLN